jgi:hypothetical protein
MTGGGIDEVERRSPASKMNIFRRVVVAVFAALALHGCATRSGGLMPVTLPPERLAQQGYSFAPLNEHGWFIIVRNAASVALARDGTNSDETYAIQATLLKLPKFRTTDELVRHVREGQAKDIDPSRFTLLQHQVIAQSEPGHRCTRSHAVAEDRGASKKTSRRDPMVLEMVTLTCAHPRSEGVGVNVSYSHRHYPGDEDKMFMRKADEVLASVDFTGR